MSSWHPKRNAVLIGSRFTSAWAFPLGLAATATSSAPITTSAYPLSTILLFSSCKWFHVQHINTRTRCIMNPKQTMTLILTWQENQHHITLATKSNTLLVSRKYCVENWEKKNIKVQSQLHQLLHNKIQARQPRKMSLYISQVLLILTQLLTGKIKDLLSLICEQILNWGPSIQNENHNWFKLQTRQNWERT